jgi:hypothetical protein
MFFLGLSQLFRLGNIQTYPAVIQQVNPLGQLSSASRRRRQIIVG